jgi:hypothetical protein
VKKEQILGDDYKYFKTFTTSAKMTQLPTCPHAELAKEGDYLTYADPLFWVKKLSGLRYTSATTGQFHHSYCTAALFSHEEL